MSQTQQSVLIVDDQDNWRKLLEEILREEFEVTVVENYECALEELSKKSVYYNVVVTDMRLVDIEKGNEDGLRLIEYLNGQDGNIKTIVLTGYPTFPSQRRALSQLAAFDYLEKHPSDGSAFNPKEFRNIVREAAKEAETNKNKLVFILMPFADEYRLFYENEIKKNIEVMGFDCKRVDDFYGSRPILRDILKSIEGAKFILADLSGRNPNVFFEVGISHALGKDILLLTQDLNDIPAHLRTLRCVLYERSQAGAAKLMPILEGAVREIQEINHPLFFFKKDFGFTPRYCLALMPNSEAGKQVYNDLVLRALAEASCKGEMSEEIFDSRSTLNIIWARINIADVIIADLSDHDADIFYLAGVAYGIGKKLSI